MRLVWLNADLASRILVHSTLRDGEHRCRLGSVAFGIMQVAPEADVQDRRVGRRVGNSPEERCTPRVEKRNPHGKTPAAIQRQPSLALTTRQGDVRKRVPPLDHDLLPSVENLSRHWRNQLGSVTALSIQLRRSESKLSCLVRQINKIFGP